MFPWYEAEQPNNCNTSNLAKLYMITVDVSLQYCSVQRAWSFTVQLKFGAQKTSVF